MEPFSRFSPQGSHLGYLLLPPRSAPVAATGGSRRHQFSTHRHATSYSPAAEFRLHGHRRTVRATNTFSWGLMSRIDRTLNGRLFIPQRQFCYQKVATGHSILSRSALQSCKGTSSPLKLRIGEIVFVPRPLIIRFTR
ncbi:hypothetical protein JTE90_020210 [Oedothorax gibbosus]|uniref:Uncharacterized protein n=1 Tax=Oedothorax gibbosus TaxID=931172 RepID=A0AAV6TFR2_9ARAC|nr:hypothetical protein JTE90_020210 [Oedothorax gibbosus]